MNFRRDGALRSLLLPGGALLGIAAAFVQSGLLRNIASVVDFCYYAAFAASVLLAWRFHSSRLFSSIVLLFLGQRAIEFFSQGHIPLAGPGLTSFEAISFLLPLSFGLLTVSQERGVSISTAVPRFLLLFVESVFVAILCRPAPSPGSHLFHGALLNRAWFSWTLVPQVSLLTFVAVFVFLVVRSILRPKPLESGLAWALLAFFLSLNAGGIGLAARAYLASAFIILVVAIIESSYAMAYHDELTGLASRRAFNEAISRLEAPYAVAAVDIDHFKNVNDTYGHETGDDVLCMVASHLARVTGGGKPFRVGGEEFTILFPGRPAREVLPVLEALRTAIEQSPFRLRRHADRRTVSRGPDRRTTTPKKSRRTQSKTTSSSSASDLTVTVSIGVAEPTPTRPELEGVLKLADEALYAAKRGGRNRVEVANSQRKRSKKKNAEHIA